MNALVTGSLAVMRTFFSGIPPVESTIMAMSVQQLQGVVTIVLAKAEEVHLRRNWSSLPPGEQYRRHVSAGGYRP